MNHTIACFQGYEGVGRRRPLPIVLLPLLDAMGTDKAIASWYMCIILRTWDDNVVTYNTHTISICPLLVYL